MVVVEVRQLVEPGPPGGDVRTGSGAVVVVEVHQLEEPGPPGEDVRTGSGVAVGPTSASRELEQMLELEDEPKTVPPKVWASVRNLQS